MALDNGFAFASQALPTPTDTPYQTPSRGISRQSSNHGSSSPYPTPSPVPFPPGESSYFHTKRESKDSSNDEQLPFTDPRRFTPNLHASLVGEILSLRREIESKSNDVLSLEESLHEIKVQNEQLESSLSTKVAESRSMKKQMQMLENGTLSALDDLAKERDAAVENLADTRKRLESSKAKISAQNADAERNQTTWERERQRWDAEKRAVERKAHIAEGRLRTVLDEVTASHEDQQAGEPVPKEFEATSTETWYTKGSETASNRSNSVKGRSRFSTNSNSTYDGNEALITRYSTLSGLNGPGGSKLAGPSLAEELEFDEDEAPEEDDYDSGVVSPDALPEEKELIPRPGSAQSVSQDQKARRVLGLPWEEAENVIEEVSDEETIDDGIREDTTVAESNQGTETQERITYTDSATQFSPPPSPKAKREPQTSPVEKEKPVEQTENAANQGRKRASAAPSPTDPLPHPRPGSRGIAPTVSAGCQTIAQPPSPPLTPNVPVDQIEIEPSIATPSTEVRSTSTQTEDQRPLLASDSVATRDEASTVSVPVIAIHPPASRPPSSHTNVVLPPRTKNVSCQASLSISTTSASTQTEEIQRFGRTVRMRSPPLSEGKSETSRVPAVPRKGSRKAIHRPPPIEAPHSSNSLSDEAKDSYPGNNDNGPLNRQHNFDLRRPVRSGSLFAGFEGPHDDQDGQAKDLDFADDEFASAAPIRKTLSKVKNSWKLVPHGADSILDRLDSDPEILEGDAADDKPEPVATSGVNARGSER